MEEQAKPSLEKALAKTEEDANNCIKVAHLVALSLRKLCNAAKSGNLKDLRAALDGMEKTELALRQQMATTKEGWTFAEEDHLSNGSFVAEVLATAEQRGVRIFERDDRLYCYPVLIRVLPSERAVRIDKATEKRLRPTVLVSRLKELQKRPPRFRPETFLEALYVAYDKAVKLKGKTLLASGTVVSLLDLYELFTLLPGQAKEYSRQEFARDIYLLDRSGVSTTRKGAKVRFHASTGTKLASRTLSVINESGEEKRYYGISFLLASVQE